MSYKRLPFNIVWITTFLSIFLVASCRVSNDVAPNIGAARGGVGTNGCSGCPPYTVAEKYRALQLPPDTQDAGGPEGLVNTVVYANAAWTQMKGGSDYDATQSTTNQIVDNLGNTWQKYTPGSIPIFQQKGYDVKYSIDWSTVSVNEPSPVVHAKLRFTH